VFEQGVHLAVGFGFLLGHQGQFVAGFRGFSGGTRKKVLALVAGTLFWEEPEKQRADVPQDAGETPSACPSQRRTPTAGADIND
jgi:hypothetical protein